ncbi:MAG TPA: hypothetical protein VGO03_19010 [Acidimicrobiia bacterium]
MAKKGKGAKAGDGVIDVEVVDDSEARPHAKPLSIMTVAKPCLIGALALMIIGAVLPH